MVYEQYILGNHSLFNILTVVGWCGYDSLLSSGPSYQSGFLNDCHYNDAQVH